jgi:hypothetical protein
MYWLGVRWFPAQMPVVQLWPLRRALRQQNLRDDVIPMWVYGMSIAYCQVGDQDEKSTDNRTGGAPTSTKTD